MRIVSLIDEEDVIERILRHLGLGQERVRVLFGLTIMERPPFKNVGAWLACGTL
jgi:hypothetical protein